MSARIGRDVVERLREALTADEVVTIRRARDGGLEIDVQGDIADLLDDWERLRKLLSEWDETYTFPASMDLKAEARAIREEK
jgi:nucleoside-diphosphate-sugar epimerase